MSQYPSDSSPSDRSPSDVPPQPARKKGPNWLLIVAVFVLGGIGLAVCSCGIVYLTLPAWSQVIADQVAKDVANDPVMQNKIGEIETITYNLAESNAVSGEGEQMMAFDVSGSKGTGLLVVDAAVKGSEIEVTSGELILADGQEFALER